MASPIRCAPASTAWAAVDDATAAAAVAAAGRTALVAGATGLVGREILQGLLADKTVVAVHTVGRRQLPIRDDKLTQHVVDFKAPFTLPGVTEAFVALGTTIDVAGSRDAFRAIDFDAVLAVARAAREAGATRLGVVSAMGANSLSRLFYTRVKGEMEEALADLGYEGVVVARPSFLAGDRAALGQPLRGGEKLALQLSRWLAPLVPDNYKSIAASDVARALLAAVPVARGRRVLESAAMRR
jgi:uncharacterized protein YbjT (DUF2867 family)